MREVREVVGRTMDEAWNSGFDIVAELFGENHVYHDPLMPDLPAGPAGVRFAVDMLVTAMPDGVLAIDEWVEEHESLVARWTWTGTNTGPLMGMAPTGRHATLRGTHLFHFRDDVIAETWASYDALGLLGQLGLVTLGIALGDPPPLDD